MSDAQINKAWRRYHADPVKENFDRLTEALARIGRVPLLFRRVSLLFYDFDHLTRKYQRSNKSSISYWSINLNKIYLSNQFLNWADLFYPNLPIGSSKPRVENIYRIGNVFQDRSDSRKLLYLADIEKQIRVVDNPPLVIDREEFKYVDYKTTIYPEGEF